MSLKAMTEQIPNTTPSHKSIINKKLLLLVLIVIIVCELVLLFKKKQNLQPPGMQIVNEGEYMTPEKRLELEKNSEYGKVAPEDNKEQNLDGYDQEAATMLNQRKEK